MSGSRWKTHRRIEDRWIIEGTLELESPAHFGNGDVSIVTDMPVARDAESDRPVLTGASIAGALRNYLPEEQARQLFGSVDGNTSVESALIVNDALAQDADDLELRDGVAINPKTRTAEDGKKFDIELIPAGARFDLCFELNVSKGDNSLVPALAIALRGLENGEIGLGKRKTRGLGQCKVKAWRVRHYQVTRPQDLIAWLNDEPERAQTGAHIAALLNVPENELPASGLAFALSAEFRLDGSLLIRAEGATVNSPDLAQLHSKRNGKPEPIVSGTSLAGALRARALKIANTQATKPDSAIKFVDEMFGPRSRDGQKIELAASHVRVRESVIEQGRSDLVQNRVAIDRFTGGAFPSALFSEQPVFGLPETRLKIELDLVKPNDAEIGLLMLLLKDLWTGDLPLGGESSVGRGRLTGRTATLKSGEHECTLHQQGDKLAIEGDRAWLEECVTNFVKKMKEPTDARA